MPLNCWRASRHQGLSGVYSTRPHRTSSIAIRSALAEVFSRALSDILQPFRLTLSQYNVLQTLRGTGSEGLTCGEVSERLSTRDSDITRLLDRLELLGFIARRRERPDRRVVRTQITEQGTGVLDAVDKLIGELQLRHLGHLGPKKMSAFSALLKSAAVTALVD
jgi:DNA-binding MarR family transcriptional regulator